MKRSYNSALRAEQAAQTRERILEALAAELTSGVDEFRLDEVAKRAGVSVRTIYQHFPNREAQIDAVAGWVDEQLGFRGDRGPRTLDEFVPFQESRVRAYLENKALMRAQFSSALAKRVRLKRRAGRDRDMAAVIAAAAPAAEARLVSALLGVVIAAETGIALEDRFGLEGEELVSVMNWAVRVLVDAVRKGDLPTVPR